MSRQVVSRSQRRLEKKQTLVLVVLGLVIALVSYGLGVMVGRSGGDTIVQEDLTASDRIAIPVPDTAPGAGTASSVEDPAAPQLTFYNTLPEGNQPPIGSGINLPDQPPEPSVDPVDVRRDTPSLTEEVPVAPAPVAAKPKVVAPKPKPVASAPAKVVATPPPASGGAYAIQVVSVQKIAGAKNLQERLSKSGYAAFVEKADLGSKGIWYRVYVGPFATRSAADGAASTLKAAHLASAPLVRKR
ncbi:SPOR domain protein [Syntrophotalea carbinolica DSM 2380]|uniref:SPOR domain protein n=1 Tax=Syntrophotalea carbinolica (strain DSM 2380 / NBRC 103641 / GraBd1) TaxID=338963 RepID=Q3A6K5_SYNC1|nr:SPOR domain-containing protein [Syntrophotalea carbinolica]ABA88002.1 SPOR domain protein [Syntrophotalea carbinolica DSM 2380]